MLIFNICLMVIHLQHVFPHVNNISTSDKFRLDVLLMVSTWLETLKMVPRGNCDNILLGWIKFWVVRN